MPPEVRRFREVTREALAPLRTSDLTCDDLSAALDRCYKALAGRPDIFHLVGLKLTVTKEDSLDTPEKPPFRLDAEYTIVLSAWTSRSLIPVKASVKRKRLWPKA